MAQLAISGIGEALAKVNIAADFAGTPGTTIPTDTIRLSGREMLYFENGHGSTNFRVKILGTGKSSYGHSAPWPFHGEGTGGLNAWRIPAGGGAIAIGPFTPYRHIVAATGLATIQYLSETETPLNLTGLVGLLKVAAYRIFPLPL